MRCFFIIGAQRSGTTLLRLMLNSHTQIAIPEEGTYWMPLLRQYRKDPHQLFTQNNFNKHIEYIWANSQFKLWDISSGEFRSKVNIVTCPDIYTLMNTIYTLYSEKHKKTMWGDKTPSFFRMVPELSFLFPHARFIHIIRDGRDLYLSWRKMDSTKGNIAVGGLEWMYKVQHAQKDLINFANSRHLQIKYEDLAANPANNLIDICHFLQIDFEPSMLEFYKNSHNFIGNHHSKLIFQPLSTISVNKWKTKLSPSEVIIFENIARKCLIENKYQLSSEELQYCSYLQTFFKLMYGLPFRAWQIGVTMLRLWFAARFGTATNASGGK